MLSNIILWFLFLTLSYATSLELENVDEGSCQPVQTVESLNQTWLTSVDKWYLGAGSKYNLYRLASTHSDFSDIREFEFYYNACYEGTWNLAAGEGQLFGLNNTLLGDWLVRLSERPFVFDFVPRSNPKDVLRHQITLTDNKSFLFFSNCWLSNNKRSWGLGFTTLDNAAKTMIENHAISMGFEKKHFAFFRYDTCGISSPKNQTINKKY